MNIFGKLPFLKSHDDEATDAELAAEAKRERIEYHRLHVRNGPQRVRTISAGQQRRADVRSRKAQARKARDKQVKGYFQTQQTAATVRGHLQAAGVIAYADLEVDPFQQVVSTAWLIQRFGVQLADDPTRMSFAQHDVRKGLESALDWYGQATETEPVFPEDYVVPVYVTDKNEVIGL